METRILILSSLWAITSGTAIYSVWRRKSCSLMFKVGVTLVCLLPFIGPILFILFDFDDRGPHGRDGEYVERDVGTPTDLELH
jgi:hypothetical protein